MKRLNRNREEGATLIELLIALALTTPLLGWCALELNRSVAQVFRTEQLARNATKELRLETLFEQYFLGLDTFPLPIPPTVHREGGLFFGDGTLNPVSQSNSRNAPYRESDAITFLSLSMEGRMRVLRVFPQGSSPVLFACYASAPAGIVPARSYVGLSNDGAFEIVPLNSVSARAGCYRLRVSATRSMSLPTPTAIDLHLLRLLIPISTHYTLYTDQNLQLRLLSHLGSENIENQPIMAGLQSFSASLQDSPEGLTTLFLRYRFVGGRERLRTVTNRIGRRPWFNILLHRS